jgi:hypothetical protein
MLGLLISTVPTQFACRLTRDDGIEDGSDTPKDSDEDVGDSLIVRTKWYENPKYIAYLNERGESSSDSRNDVSHID